MSKIQEEISFRDRLPEYITDARIKLGQIVASGLLAVAGTTAAYSADSLIDPTIAEATACSGTHCDAQGTTELSGSDWLGGGGVDVYANNGSAAYDSGVNKYVTMPSGANVKSGEEWQCVELVNRLYLSKGWINNTWSGNGNTLKDHLPAGLTYEANGSIGSIKSGDAITLDDGGYGHVGIINSYNATTGSVDIVNQNTAQVHSSATLSNKTLTMAGWAGYSVQGIIEAPTGATAENGSSTYADGNFLHATDTGNVYEMAGGAPIRLFNWGAIPEFHGQATDVSQATINALPAYPKDGTFVNIAEAGGNGIYEFVGGAPIRQYNWGILNGFGSRPVEDINYQSLQVLDHMRLTPADGSFANIHEAGGNGVYEFVGGAPIRQYDWGSLKGFPGGATADINYQSLQTLDHMHAVPNNGSFMNIHEAGGNGVYEFIGGAPVRQSDWGNLPRFSGANTPDVNYSSLVNLDHMNATPSDGTFVNIAEAGGNGVYEFVGGAPLRQYNWGILPNFNPNMPSINYTSLVNLDHMNPVPHNGEFVASAETGAVYRMAGGSALRLYNQGGIPGYNGALWVNQQTLDTYDHQNAAPADGTVIEGVTSQTYWQIQGGKRVATSPNNNAVVVDEQTVANIPN
ncbi:MAG TPA: CHAP domain-containing protein [Candidatus Saccharimonadales bacterium]|nr:CHAP domain-containing protein [Candidatus Saccharimonadales bacterium]